MSQPCCERYFPFNILPTPISSLIHHFFHKHHCAPCPALTRGSAISNAGEYLMQCIFSWHFQPSAPTAPSQYLAVVPAGSSQASVPAHLFVLGNKFHVWTNVTVHNTLSQQHHWWTVPLFFPCAATALPLSARHRNHATNLLSDPLKGRCSSWSLHPPSPRTPSHFCSFPCCRARSIGQILKSDLALKDFKSLTLSISGLYVCILPGKQDSCPTEALTLTAIGMILLNTAIIALELRVEGLHQIHPHKDEDTPSEKIKCNPGLEQHLESSKLCLWVRWERSRERSLT